MTRIAGTWGRDVRFALAAGVVGGALFGVREGVATVFANAFAESGRYLLAYLVTPLALWCVLGPLVLLPFVVAFRLLGVRPNVPRYFGVVAAVGTALAALPSLEDAATEMTATGATPGPAVLVMLGALLALLAATIGVLVSAAVARHEPRVTAVLPRTAVAIAVVCAIAAGFSGAVLLREIDPGTAASAHATPRPDAPNVVLVSIDTLRADELGSYGSTHGNTPVLDRFAADGVTFRNAFAAAPWTLPSLASLMTGLYPRHHAAGGVTNRYDPLGRAPLSPDVRTVADMLAAEGYDTHAIVTNPYLLTHSGLARGFATYDNLTFLSEAMVAGRRNAAQWLLDHLAPDLVSGDRGRDVSDRAVTWLRGRSDGRPFFLWLHYIDAHAPYAPVAATRHKSFRGDSLFGARTDDSDAFVSPDPARLRSGEVRLDETQKRQMRELYRAEIREVDRQVGRVLDALHERGLDDQTLVVCVSDHGEEFWDHGGVEHGHTLYDELLHVVLMMRWPGRLPAGLAIDPVVRLTDVAPTVLDALQLDTPPALDGRSMLSLVRGEDDAPRTALAENLLFAEERVALRTATQKYIRWTNGKEEVYDLVHDPAELRDLAGREDAVTALRAELSDVEHAMAPAVVPGRSAPTSVAALRALGYVQ